MAWWHQAAGHCLHQHWPRSVLPYGVTKNKHELTWHLTISSIRPKVYHVPSNYWCLTPSVNLIHQFVRLFSTFLIYSLDFGRPAPYVKTGTMTASKKWLTILGHKLPNLFNSLWFKDAIWHLITWLRQWLVAWPHQPQPESILTCTRYISWIWFWKLQIQNYSRMPQGPVS